MSAFPFPKFLSRKIGDFTFEIPTTLQPGDTLSLNDAMLYNTARIRNIAQTYWDRVKKAVEEKKTFSEINEEVQAFAKTYTYSPSLDYLPPIDREMLSIAEQELTAFAKRKGTSWDSLPRSKRDELIASHLNRHSSRLRTEAEKRISDLNSIADDIDIDFSDL